MTALVNLLPWRERHRKHQLFLWGGITLLAVAVPLLGVTMHSLANSWQLAALRGQQVWLQAHIEALTHDYQQRRDHLDMLAIQEKRYRKLQAKSFGVQRWQPLLTELAVALPPQAWLNSVIARSSKVEIKGFTPRPDDVLKLENALAGMREVADVQPGRMEHEPQGRMSFAFTLQLKEVPDAPAR